MLKIAGGIILALLILQLVPLLLGLLYAGVSTVFEKE